MTASLRKQQQVPATGVRSAVKPQEPEEQGSLSSVSSGHSTVLLCRRQFKAMCSLLNT